MDTPDDRLLGNVDRLKGRLTSEEGIPMFLACEDLRLTDTAAAPGQVKPTSLNRDLASAFCRDSEALHRLRPDASATDVHKVIVEMLADEDFACGKIGESENALIASSEQEPENLYSAKPIIRALNFHNTPQARAAQYDRELAHYSQFFSSVNEDELGVYLSTGRWHKPKPGLIVAVYEGYRNGYDVLAPLLERHGFTGWFFIVTGFVNAAVEDQLTFTEGHRIRMQTREYGDGRYALTWEEIRELDRKHVIASHTRSHWRLSTLDGATLDREIVGAQEDFEEHLGHKVRVFCSLKGPACGEDPSIDRLVVDAGYDFVFSNFRIQRVNAMMPAR